MKKWIIFFIISFFNCGGDYLVHNKDGFHGNIFEDEQKSDIDIYEGVKIINKNQVKKSISNGGSVFNLGP